MDGLAKDSRWMLGGSGADWNFRGAITEGLVRCSAGLPDAFLYMPAQAGRWISPMVFGES